MDDISRIRLYLFEKGDSRKAEERIAAAVANLTGKPANIFEWKLRYKKKGKPYFKKHSEFFLSITHSGEYWACALSNLQVGIDLQMHILREGETEYAAGMRYANLAKRFFHEKEANYVQAKASYKKFFRIWAAKESYVKYTGKGIDDEFGSFSVIPESENSLPEYYSGDGYATWTAAGVCFVECLKGKIKNSDYTLCVCGKWPVEILEIKHMNFK
ncbi:MAG: 4'-phosphopantetheinyl transferase superfamily protein [Lachnospiraceae bacterium]|nr:4'-phosphopantetheinyl transferase superfamily protein [Lachnospiraceae bacterium]